MPRPPVPPAPTVDPAVPVPVARALRLGAVTLDLERPRVILQVGAAAIASGALADQVRRADAVALDLVDVVDPAEGAALVTVLLDRSDGPVLVRGATPPVLEGAVAAGASGALVEAGEPLAPIVPPLAAGGAALLVVERPAPEPRSPAHRDELARAASALAPATLVREVASGDPDAAGLPLLVVDRGAAPDERDAIDPELLRARRVGAITRGVARGGRLVLTDDVVVARRTAEVLGAILTAEAAP